MTLPRAIRQYERLVVCVLQNLLLKRRDGSSPFSRSPLTSDRCSGGDLLGVGLLRISFDACFRTRSNRLLVHPNTSCTPVCCSEGFLFWYEALLYVAFSPAYSTQFRLVPCSSSCLYGFSNDVVRFLYQRAFLVCQATLVVNEKPGYRQLPSAAYFPSPQGVSHAATTLFDLSEAQGTHYNNVVCAGEDKTNQHECTEPSVLHGRNSVLSGQSREDNSTATDTGRNASAVAEEGKTNMKQFHKSNKKSNNGNNPATFRWKGQNYLQKMAHDLEFLDDATVSAPVSAWLGFSVRDNPFLIPPDDHDVCGALRRQHEQRRKASASRRRQQPRRDSNGRRRSHSRAHPNSSAGASGDVFAACPAPEEAPLTVLEFDSRSRMSVEERRTKTPAGCGNNSGFEMTEASLGSMSASIDPLLQGLTDLEEEVISCELSSGEEEEVRWDGGGQLDAPLVPSLPECVCRKAAAAAEILSSERASQHLLEQKVRGILANARRAKQILHVPRAQYSSRLESLALRSAREGLRGALKDRHVGTTKFQSMSVEAFGSEAGHLTRVSTAPANGVGQHGREAIATTTGSGHSGRSPVFSRRGGMRVFADGWTADMATEDGDGGANRSCGASNTSNTMIIGLARSSSLAFARAIGLNHNELPAWSISFCHLSAQGPSTAHLPYLKQIDSVAAEGTTSIPSTAERSAEWSSEQSTAASSLQASSSSMSAHAHAKAVAARPTATRRARRNGGKIIVMDPAKSPETSGRAADLIQAAFLATRARSYVRRLQAQREGATTLIGRIWRGCRVRLVIRTENRLRRAEELRNRVQNRMRTRAAHLITIFFRDIVYRRRRVSIHLTKRSTWVLDTVAFVSPDGRGELKTCMHLAVRPLIICIPLQFREGNMGRGGGLTRGQVSAQTLTT